MLLAVRVRRLFCENGACSRRTFAEPLPGLAGSNARRTTVSDPNPRVGDELISVSRG
jgi:hypothetical protein